MEEYILISDMFLGDYTGGAELTTDAIIETRRDQISKIRSREITSDFINENCEKTWIIANCMDISFLLKMKIIKKVAKYYFIEYDYKYCKFRNPIFHKFVNEDCACEKESVGKINLLLIAKSCGVFFMSEGQRKLYLEKFPILEKTKTYVLSSVFSKEILEFFKDYSIPKKNNKWAILGSNMPVKATRKTVSYAKLKKYQYEVLGNLPYKKFIKKISLFKGLIFRPGALDTCPRIVIEAKLLGCKLILNENVQHKDEDWFKQEKGDIIKYLEGRSAFFWDIIEEKKI